MKTSADKKVWKKLLCITTSILLCLAACDRGPGGNVDEHVHDWGEWTVTEEPTCVRTGERQRACKSDPSHSETEEIAAYNERYKEYRDMIFGGKFYRIKSPFSGERRIAAQLLVSEDGRRALLTVLQLNGNYDKRWEAMKLKGLKKDGRYFCPQTGKTYAGGTLMNMGVIVDGLKGNGACRQYEFRICE